jgi:hypothetical protein
LLVCDRGGQLGNQLHTGGLKAHRHRTFPLRAFSLCPHAISYIKKSAIAVARTKGCLLRRAQ